MPRNNLAGAINAYPGVPPLSWVFAKRVTNPYESADVFAATFGRKGMGKSTMGLALCESTARYISYLRGKNEDPEQFFTIDHVVSVSKEGAINLLTSGILKKENSVILLDDVSTQWNSRAAMSWINRALNDILTISRVFRCVIIANCVQSSHLDKVARELTDYQIHMVSKNTYTGQSICKAYYCEIGSNGDMYRKFLTFHGNRVKYWVCERPSKEIESQYRDIRMKNTVTAIDQLYEKMIERNGTGEPKTDGRIKDYTQSPEYEKHGETIREMTANKERVEEIVRKTGLTRYKIQRIQSAQMNAA